MKKAAFVILSLAFAAAILSPLTASADTFGPYTYTTNAAGQATITDFDASYSGALSITNELGGCPVTTIGSFAFYYGASLTSVTIPDSVTAIEDYVFARCYNLTSVTIGSRVTTIGSYAFYDCEFLTTVTIPTGVTSIGNCAFLRCYSLASVSIPFSVNGIGINAFEDCDSLTSVTIPASVTTIGDYAFAYCDSLTSVFFAGPSPFHYDFPVFDSSPATIYYLPAFAPYWPSYFGTRPTKLWNPAFTGTALAAGAVSCTVTGSPPIPIAMEATTNLAAGPWVRLCTTNLTNNSITLHDSDSSSHPARFYRIIGP